MGSQDTLSFSVLSGVRSMNEVFPLERAPEAYERMMSGKARFRAVLTTGNWLSQEKQMNDFLARVTTAHGGLDRWNKFKKVTTTYVGGGGLWPMKGLEVFPHPIEVMVTLHEETSSIGPFGQADWHASFMPDRIAIETTTGNVVSARSDPRASFTGHVMDTPWDPLHRAYFMGYAQWTYLTTPFFMTMPGLEVTEI